MKINKTSLHKKNALPGLEVRVFKPAIDDFWLVAKGTEALPHQIEKWPKDLKNNTISLVVAYLSGKPVGSVVLRWPSDNHPFPPVLDGLPTVQSLRVREKCRCRGIGTQLMLACEDLLRARPDQKQKLALGVRVSNKVAQNLYDGLGYKRKKIDGKDLTYHERLYERGPDGKIQQFPALCYLMTKDILAG